MTETRSWGDLVARTLRSLVLVVVVLVAVGAVAAVATGSYQARPVLTGSMRPGLPVGGVVVTKRVPLSSLKVRDVIVFHRPDIPTDLVVHRIIAMNQVGGSLVIQTQGDNNPIADPWKVTLRGATAYRAQFSVPLVGYAAVWWQQPRTHTIALLLAGAFGLAALVILAFSGLRRRSTDEPVDATEPASGTAVSETDETSDDVPAEQRDLAELSG
jgi:signal peptidase